MLKKGLEVTCLTIKTKGKIFNLHNENARNEKDS